MSVTRIINKFYKTKSLKMSISNDTWPLSYDIWFNNINFANTSNLELIKRRAKKWKYKKLHKFFIKKMVALSQALKKINKDNNTNYYMKIRDVAILIEETETSVKKTEGFGFNKKMCNKEQFYKKMNDVLKLIE